MVKIVKEKRDIINLWSEAFGDSDEDIMFFIKNAKNAECVGYYVNSNLVSMLYLVDCSLGKYIYAACTLKEYEGKGYMTLLLNYCKDIYDDICLIPANDGLIDFYKKRGFTQEFNTDKLTFHQIDAIVDYLFDGCSLDVPIVLSYKKR